MNSKRNSSRRRTKLYIFAIPIVTIIFLAGLAIYTPAPSRVIVIGLDAADWDILNPLLDDGRLPNMQMLIDGGVSAKLETIEPSLSAAVWTTISTGVKRNVHGIKDFVIPDSGGLPYNSGMRKVPAIWNVVSHFNKRVCYIGHWTSWPAEKVNGYIVSSFISYNPEEAPPASYQGETYEVVNVLDKTYPPELLKDIEHLVFSWDEVTEKDLDPFFEIEDWEDPDLYKNTLNKTMTYLVPFFYAADKTYYDVFDYLWQEKGPYDLIYTYIEGTDTNAHRFWHFYDTTYLEEAMEFWGYDLDDEDKYIRCFGDTLNRQYEWADSRLGGIMDNMGPRDTLIILSDHGFGPWNQSEDNICTYDDGLTFSGNHSHFGVIMLYGHNIRQGHKITGPPPDLTDVVPTILSLLKLPAAQWMEGSPITEAFTERFNKTSKLRWIREYGIEDQYGHQNIQSPFDEELVNRMKSLGYLQ
jgi:predicted AlkP superfamily phosphohydrolase/phosphomutase